MRQQKHPDFRAKLSSQLIYANTKYIAEEICFHSSDKDGAEIVFACSRVWTAPQTLSSIKQEAAN